MSNHLTRIEREARQYAEKTWEGFRPNIETSARKVQSRVDYKIGANREKDLADTLVKVLERISDENEIDGLHVFDLMEIAKEALEQYKKETE